MPSYKEDTPSHQPLYSFIFINNFINVFSYFPVYSFGRLSHGAGNTVFQPAATTPARGSDAAVMPQWQQMYCRCHLILTALLKTWPAHVILAVI